MVFVRVGGLTRTEVGEWEPVRRQIWANRS